MTLNAPLFEGLVDSKAMVRGSWGAAPVSGLEPRPGDFVVEKMRMSAWEGTRLETILKATGRDMIINTGAWTNMSVEHTARTGADKGYFMIVPEDCCSTMNADWHNAAINFAMQNVAVVTKADTVIKALGLKRWQSCCTSSCSPRRRSRNRAAGARVFLDGFRKARPDWDIDAMNLWRERMPEFAGRSCWRPNMPGSNGQAFNNAQRDAFAERRTAGAAAVAGRIAC